MLDSLPIPALKIYKMLENVAVNVLKKKLDEALKKKSISNEVSKFKDQVFKGDRFSQSVFKKIYERYLSMRTLLSRDVDLFVEEVYQPVYVSPSKLKSSIYSIDETDNFFTSNVSCIVGKAGQGKTTFLKMLLLKSIKEKEEKFPLIISLREVKWSDQITVPSVVINELRKLGIESHFDLIDTLISEGFFRIFYDGFDEVELNHRENACSLIIDTYALYDCPCIVTTRPNTEIQMFSGSVQNFELMDLTKEQLQAIISNHRQKEKKDKERLLKVIESSADITNTLVTPILVDIFLSTYNYLEEEPKNIVDFYQNLFITLASTHDRFKTNFKRPTLTSLTNRDLQHVFEQACFILLNNQNSSSFNEEVTVNAFEKAAQSQGFGKVQTVHKEIINKTSLLKEDGLEFTFIHKSILEFHAAKYIAGLNDKQRAEYYKLVIENPKASNESILSFLKLIDEDLFYIAFAKELINQLQKGHLLENTKLISRPMYNFFCHSAFVDLDIKNETISNIKMRSGAILIDQHYSAMNMLAIFFDFPFIRIDSSVEQRALIKGVKSHPLRELVGLTTSGKGCSGNMYQISLKSIDVIDLKLLNNEMENSEDIQNYYASLSSLEQKIKEIETVYESKNAFKNFY
ncbi:NACHT domain-containing protein [Pseudoalteromonas xiamenensis]|uniref:NACHT domain-containing protein n=1 Tax=Pseudoalteromonas xiamenensis TaxID=882626 RepID=UPI0035EEFBFD